MGAMRDRGELDYTLRQIRDTIEDLYRKGEISRRDCEEAMKDSYRRVMEYFSGRGPTDPLDIGALDIRVGNKTIRMAMPYRYDPRSVKYFSPTEQFFDEARMYKEAPPTALEQPQKVQPKKQVKLLLLTKEA